MLTAFPYYGKFASKSEAHHGLPLFREIIYRVRIRPSCSQLFPQKTLEFSLAPY